jgi:hypothetical protein
MVDADYGVVTISSVEHCCVMNFGDGNPLSVDLAEWMKRFGG